MQILSKNQFRRSVIVAVFLGLGLASCQKKTASTSSPATPSSVVPPVGTGADAPIAKACPPSGSPSGLGLFKPATPVDPATLQARIAEIKEERVVLKAVPGQKMGSGVHHNLLVSFAASMADGAVIRPDGYWMDVCDRAGQTCISRLSRTTEKLRVLPDDVLSIAVRACMRDEHVTGAQDTMAVDHKVYRGEHYTCSTKVAKSTLQMEKNSGDLTAYRSLMEVVENAGSDFRKTATQLHQHMRDFYPVDSKQSNLSDFEKSMANNIAVGPEVFSDKLEIDGPAMFQELDSTSAQATAPRLALTAGADASGCPPVGGDGAGSSDGNSAAGGQSLDDILKGLAGASGPSGSGKSDDLSARMDNGSGAGNGSGTGSGSSDSAFGAGDTGNGTSISGQAVETPEGDDYARKRGFLIAGGVVTMVGTVLYFTAREAAPPANPVGEQSEEKQPEVNDSAEEVDKVVKEKVDNETKRMQSEAADVHAAEVKKLDAELAKIETKIKAIDGKINQKYTATATFTDQNIAEKKQELAKSKEVLFAQKTELSNKKADLKKSLSSAQALSAEAKSKTPIFDALKSKEVRRKGGIGLMVGGVLLSAYGILSLTSSTVKKSNIFQDATFLQLSQTTFDNLKATSQAQLKAAELEEPGNVVVRSLVPLK